MMFKKSEACFKGIPDRNHSLLSATLVNSSQIQALTRCTTNWDSRLPDVSLKIKIGDVSINAVEHPFKGVVLIFRSITPRTMCQYEVSLPERSSAEQIAGLIYVNVAENFRDSAAMFKAHFQKLGLTLFQ
jgi:hypothetical protein